MLGNSGKKGEAWRCLGRQGRGAPLCMQGEEGEGGGERKKRAEALPKISAPTSSLGISMWCRENAERLQQRALSVGETGAIV